MDPTSPPPPIHPFEAFLQEYCDGTWLTTAQSEQQTQDKIEKIDRCMQQMFAKSGELQNVLFSNSEKHTREEMEKRLELYCTLVEADGEANTAKLNLYFKMKNQLSDEQWNSLQKLFLENLQKWRALSQQNHAHKMKAEALSHQAKMDQITREKLKDQLEYQELLQKQQEKARQEIARLEFEYSQTLNKKKEGNL